MMERHIKKINDPIYIKHRLKTFELCPPEYIKDDLKHILAISGFEYIGPQDTVQCMFCFLKLAFWKHEDDPLLEHAYMSPRCSLVEEMTSESMIDIIIGVKYTRPQVPTDVKKKYILSKWNHHLGICDLCLIRRVVVVFYPCGHLLYCKDCAKNMRSCYECKSTIRLQCIVRYK